jgi:GWxTD domain-containing protein
MKCGLYILLLFQSLLSFPETEIVLPDQSSGDLSFYVDVCQFRKSDTTNTLELTYSINLNQFLPVPESRETIRFSIDFLLKDAAGTVIDEKHELKHVQIGRDKSKAGLYVDLLQFIVSQDSMFYQILITDLDGVKKGSVTRSMHRRSYSKGFSISDLFFAGHIQKAATDGVYNKGGVMMIPQPSRTFCYSEKSPNFYIYFEINNLAVQSDRPCAYTVNDRIDDCAGKEIMNQTSQPVTTADSHGARVEKVPLQNMSPGLYRLNVFVTDLNSGEICSTMRYFQVTTQTQDAAHYLSMKPDDIKRYYDQIKYIATDEELKIYNSLDDRGREQFLIDFWQRRDADPTTPENEVMQEHFRRIAYAESHFRGGLNSDMGRIYIQYGTPVDIQRHVSSIEYGKPTEIWTYAINGRTEFVFVDRSDDGRYFLMHSTHPDEYQNPDWMTNNN